jgi:hypothetical protein
MTRRFGGLAVAALLFPVGAFAQQAGAIAGVVRDSSGGVLPGVTVEASSPALIEKVRAVSTDDAGQYRIVDLRPGVYTTTFSLTGFATVKREGIELTAGFTANGARSFTLAAWRKRSLSLAPVPSWMCKTSTSSGS